MRVSAGREERGMNNFYYDIPTRIYFGKGQITHLEELKESGNKVLLVYGGGSIKRNGIYQQAMEILHGAELTVYELEGVEPNPRIQLVRKGIEICVANDIDMVLAIGGGSAIDTAKLVAAGVPYYPGDAWDLMVDPDKICSALPIYCVLTLAATGSEMDNSTVISDLTINEKRDIVSDHLKPTMSICDPTYTYTVSAKQTAAGAVDIMSHVLENYFTNVPGTNIQAHICEAILRTVIESAPLALAEPCNYDARANLMWSSSLALNNLTAYGAEVTWCMHPIEYGPSAFYDITHGIGLAILTPVWMRYVLSEKTAARFAEYGHRVWDIPYERFENKESAGRQWQVAEAAIEKTADFFRQLGMPSCLSEVGITSDEHFHEMALAAAPLCQGCFVELTVEDIEQIYRLAL